MSIRSTRQPKHREAWICLYVQQDNQNTEKHEYVYTFNKTTKTQRSMNMSIRSTRQPKHSN
jgi:hypothetical protein